MKKIIIDTDGEFDDFMALVLALKSRDLSVEAITTLSGIRGLRDSTDDVLNAVELLGRGDVSVGKGLEVSMSQDLTEVRRDVLRVWRAGGRLSTRAIRKPGLKPVKEDGVSLLIRTINENPGEITLVTLGALTNVASALLREPGIARKVKDVYTMGGAVLVPGNMTPVAEFNIWGDPLAAKIFFNSGMHITMIGLETYNQPVLTGEEWNRVREANQATRYCFENFDPWFKYLVGLHPERNGGLEVGDALTVGAVIDPSLMRSRRCFIDVETQGRLTVGQTVAYGLSGRQPAPKELNTDLTVDCDWMKFNRLFMDRVVS
ncbi:MAG: nucleoside hydrolase [Candidatus Bathyarchaeia archaeon]|jgi:purine nucleosidase